MSEQPIIATNVTRKGYKSRSKRIEGGECIIPFYFKGKVYQDCVEGADGKGRTCPTQLFNDQKYTKGGIPKSPFKKKGYCPDTDLSSSEIIQPKKRKSRTKKFLPESMKKHQKLYMLEI